MARSTKVYKCGCVYDSTLKGMDKYIRCKEAQQLLDLFKKTKKFSDRINYDNHYKQ